MFKDLTGSYPTPGVLVEKAMKKNAAPKILMSCWKARRLERYPLFFLHV
jgi:hypothetical protein